MIWTLQSMFGQFFDATVGQMVNALAGGRPASRGAPWPGAPAAPGTARAALPPAPPQPVTLWPPPAAGAPAAVERQESRESGAPGPKDLDDDEIKLVKYGLVSIRPCHEKVLWGGVILVTTPMTSTSFSSWIVALYLQSDVYRAAVRLDPGNEIAHADKKYLRVAWGVLTRWPRTPKSGCGQGKLNALKGIRDAIRGYRPAPPAETTALVPVATAPPRPPRRQRQPQASAPPAQTPPSPPPPEPGRRPGRRPRPGEPRRRPR